MYVYQLQSWKTVFKSIFSLAFTILRKELITDSSSHRDSFFSLNRRIQTKTWLQIYEELGLYFSLQANRPQEYSLGPAY